MRRWSVFAALGIAACWLALASCRGGGDGDGDLDADTDVDGDSDVDSDTDVDGDGDGDVDGDIDADTDADGDSGTGTVHGTVTHIYTSEPLEGVVIQALDGTTVAADDATATDGTYELVLPAGDYMIHPDVEPADDCFSDLDDEAVTVAGSGDDHEVNFSYVPGPCG